MTEEEARPWVPVIAHAVRATPQLAVRPAPIRTVTTQMTGPAHCAVWVVTGLPDEPVCFRFRFFRLLAVAPIVSTGSLSVIRRGKAQEISYWDVPPNIRDIGATVGARALGMPFLSGYRLSD